MYNEIYSIRKKIIDKIILISVIFLTPAYFSSLARWMEIGFQPISIIHTSLYVVILVLLIFRKRFSIELKIYGLLALYSILGVAALWYYGFSGIHYFVIIAIAVANILAERKTAFIFMAILAMMYVLIGLAYMLGKHQSAVDLNVFSHSILQWTTIILSLIAFSAIFAEGFGELYHHMVKTFEDNRKIQNSLEYHNQQLISTKQELDKKVTEFHDLNVRLQQSEDKYKKLVNFSPNIIYWYSKLEGALFFSDKIKEVLGYEPDGNLGIPGFWENLIHPEDQEKFKKVFENVVPEKQYELSYRVKAKDGDWKWMNDTVSIISKKDDNIIFQGLLADISEKVETEQKLKDSELRWQFSVVGSEMGLWDWNIATDEVFFSKQWKKMLGYREDEIEATLEEWEKRVHPDELPFVKEALSKHLSGESEVYRCEYRMRCKNGTYTWILDRGKITSFSADFKPQRMIGTHTDINDRMLAELELKRSNATKDRFFSIIAHDLKNPFNSMIGLSELLNDNFDELDVKTQKKFISAVHEGILKTYDLLEDLLLWSRAQRNTIDFYPKPVDLQTTVEEVLNPLQMAAENKAIEITLDIKNQVVQADNFMLAFILRNLIMNAIKFTPREGKILVESEQVRRRGEKSVKIAVHDTGIGIDKEYLQRIFDIGQNVSRPGTENEKGTGMGLPICCEFVKKHKGEIWVESMPGEGSHFFFTIPDGQI